VPRPKKHCGFLGHKPWERGVYPRRATTLSAISKAIDSLRGAAQASQWGRLLYSVSGTTQSGVLNV
jgi:hypothetical protein